ncbi:MAG: GGDEF domain-containing protein [Firmicutes bacterium]|nr:GGDEF domain-containing protein [Bacillota bacterium]
MSYAPHTLRHIDRWHSVQWGIGALMGAYLGLSVIGLNIFWTHHPAAVRAGLLDYVAAQSALTLLLLLGMRALVWTLLVQPLEHRTIYDELTGLCRPGAFWERAEHQVAQAYRLRHSVAFVFLDLDDFKALNDTHGHAMGDAVLYTFGTILRQSARQGDTIGRLGGEECGWLLPGATVPDAVAATDRLLATFRRTTAEAGHRITCSAGVAVLPATTQEPLSAWDLGRLADQALYQAKAAGKDRVVVAATPDEETG